MKTVNFFRSLNPRINRNFQIIDCSKRKTNIYKIIDGKIVNKYRVLGHAKQFLPKKLCLANAKRIDKFSYERLPTNSKAHVLSVINTFWEDEEHTTMCPGKKDYI